jgi:hypothetical protein
MSKILDDDFNESEMFSAEAIASAPRKAEG